MVGISVGVLVGGIVADRFFQFNFIATVGYLVASFLMVQVALAWLPFWFVMSAFLIGGFMMGVVFPSRDLMVREASPKDSAGKAFGFVNSGFGYGAMVGPLICGLIMDSGFTKGVFLMSAGIMILAIATAILAGALTPTKANGQST
jgi:MFS family permease